MWIIKFILLCNNHSKHSIVDCHRLYLFQIQNVVKSDPQIIVYTVLAVKHIFHLLSIT